MQKITPFLWYNGNVEDAVAFYTSVFKNSKVLSSNSMSAVIELEGQRLNLFNGGPMFKFTEAISLFVSCETQQEVDYYWEHLSAGGEESRCGWLKDKFGLSWQVVPSVLMKLLWSPDRNKADSVMQTMLKMNKLDISLLQAAYDKV
jgi:predicted 3-demethylubiquinone-9 3-methyltransferase (glyoxalase superfamily)